jgi:hypothetical protein
VFLQVYLMVCFINWNLYQTVGGFGQLAWESQTAALDAYPFWVFKKFSWVHQWKFSCCQKDSQNFQCTVEQSSSSHWIRGSHNTQSIKISILLEFKKKKKKKKKNFLLIQQECFLQLIQDLILNHGGEKLDDSIFQLISSILHILAKVFILIPLTKVLNA